MPKARNEVIVDHSDRLHKRVNDSRADELEPAPFQFTADFVGKRSFRGNFGERFVKMRFGFAVYKTPDKLVKTAELLLYFDKRFGVCHGGVYFQTVADYVRIFEQFGDFFAVVPRDFFGVEIIERRAETLALFKYRYP